MKIFQASLITLGLALIGPAPACAQSAQEFYDLYAGKPVTMKLPVQGGFKEVDITGYENGALQAVIPGAGVIGYPVDNKAMLNGMLIEYNPDRDAIKAGLFEKGLRTMRPQAYALLPFAAVPEDAIILHRILTEFTATLVEAQLWDEAIFWAERLPVENLGTQYVQWYVSLAEGLSAVDRETDGVRVLTRIPTGKESADVVEDTLNAIAEDLRYQQRYTDAIPIYERLMSSGDPDVVQQALLWLVHAKLSSGDRDAATTLFSGIVEPEPTKDVYSLYKFLEGLRLMNEGDFKNAQLRLSRCLISGKPGDPWMAETMYRLGENYAKLQSFPAARNTLDELGGFYPNTPWAKKALALISELDALEASMMSEQGGAQTQSVEAN